MSEHLSSLRVKRRLPGTMDKRLVGIAIPDIAPLRRSALRQTAPTVCRDDERRHLTVAEIDGCEYVSPVTSLDSSSTRSECAAELKIRSQLASSRLRRRGTIHHRNFGCHRLDLFAAALNFAGIVFSVERGGVAPMRSMIQPGCLSASSSNRSAAPSGSRVPCSHFFTVSGLTFSAAAKIG